jgi:hypothetical protein
VDLLDVLAGQCELYDQLGSFRQMR